MFWNKRCGKYRQFFLCFYFPFTFCLETKSNKKFKATKIPPAQSDRLTNATLASKTALIFLQFFLSWCGFSNRLPTSVRKSLQTFTLFRLVCGLSQRTCADTSLHVKCSTCQKKTLRRSVILVANDYPTRFCRYSVALYLKKNEMKSLTLSTGLVRN